MLLALFLVSWALQTWTGWREYQSEQQEHQQQAEVFGSDGYIWKWSEATFENWQSEFLQLLTMVTLTSFLVFKGSAESKDSDEEMQEALDRIEQRLDILCREYQARGGADASSYVVQTQQGAITQ